MDPKVSIIIPVYRTAEWLPKCMDSCLGQTYGNIEIILVDDGSPDNCGELCDQYAASDARVLVIHQENGGVSVAMNAGMKKATGEFLLFIASDDWIDLDMVSCMVEAQLAGPYDLVVSGLRNYIDSKNIVEQTPVKKAAVGRFNVLSDLLDRENLIYMGFMVTALFKKSIIDAFGIELDPFWRADQDSLFVWEYMAHVNSCFYLDRTFYNYRLVTYDKKDRYRYDELAYQWNHCFEKFGHFKDLYLSTGTYADLKEKVDVRILAVIQDVINNAITHHSPGRAVISQVKTITSSELYEDLKALHLADAKGIYEKTALICCKYKLWGTLYLCFRLIPVIANPFMLKVYHKLRGST